MKSEVSKLIKLGYKIAISDESDLLLETGGGLYKARDFFDTTSFLLFNADIVTDLDLEALYLYHKEKNGLATLAVRNRKDSNYFLINQEGLLSGWCSLTTGKKILTGYQDNELYEIAFSGIHIIEPEIFQYMEEGIYTMTSLYLRLAALYKIYTFRCDTGYWFDIGTPENLEKARLTTELHKTPEKKPFTGQF
jgi:NDP-sugar pyrophosphorylase family protein